MKILINAEIFMDILLRNNVPREKVAELMIRLGYITPHNIEPCKRLLPLDVCRRMLQSIKRSEISTTEFVGLLREYQIRDRDILTLFTLSNNNINVAALVFLQYRLENVKRSLMKKVVPRR